jgi:hypothetical protein
MSKILSPISTVLASILLILQFFTLARTQDVDVRLQVKAGDQRSAISGQSGEGRKLTADLRILFPANMPPKELWFMDSYAGLTGLFTGRFSPIYFYDKQGYLIARRGFAATDNFSSRNVSGLRYTVDLDPSRGSFAAAHLSWANADGGLIMLDDLLPQGIGKTAKVTLELPAGWKTITSEAAAAPNAFTVSNVEKAVFYTGPDIREPAGNLPLKLAITGEWLFTDAEASAMVNSIFAEYERLFGGLPTAAYRVRIAKFPNPNVVGNWEADTRGRSVTILSSDMPFKNQSLQRLHEQLRHELFHLWVPNGINLSGNYDWFYEGFALYQSLKTGVAVNQLRFEDFLDTLSRAYEIDSLQTKRQSLIEATKNRWSGSNTQVYARGMLVAFLCDLAMLDASKGKRSVPVVIREVFENHRNATPIDGNTAVIAVLKEHRELIPIVDRYVLGAESLDWKALLQTAGIEAGNRGLSVPAKPSRRQKDTLDKLGYNNWRRMNVK